MAQTPQIITKNFGKINPDSLEDYRAAGGYKGLEKALSMKPADVINELVESGLRGRGGAGFPTGLKNKFTSESCPDCSERFIVVNADEGEPGTFKDRLIMENDPHLYLEGAIIVAWAIQATRGIIYIRGEYQKSIEKTEKAIVAARQKGLLGKNILGSGFDFDVEIKLGAGSYLCGEELTMLESIEGKRGYPRIKPPFPAEKGLFGMPTLVNNVETMACIPFIISQGSKTFSKLGTKDSPGTKIFTLSGNVNKPGYYETPLGVTLRELIYDMAGGVSDGKTFKAALLGGAAGTFVDSSFLDEPLCYDNLKSKGATLGSGAIIVLNSDSTVSEILINVLRFFKHESCGKCVPCRTGTTMLLKEAEKLINGSESNKQQLLESMIKQSRIMAATALCPLGQSPVMPLETADKYFRTELIG